jgi:HK97 family phage portal protein
VSLLLGRNVVRRERRSMLGGPFRWHPSPADFSTTDRVPAPSEGLSASAEASLQKVAVWGCVDLTAKAGEMLPVDVFTGVGAAKHEVEMPGWMEDLGGQGFGLHDWVSQFIYSGMLRGNVIAPVVARDPRSGLPTCLPIAHPDDVKITRDGGWRIGGYDLGVDEVWHRRMMAPPGSRMGLSVIEVHMTSIGLGLDALRFGAKWFQDGGIPSSLLTTEQDLDQPKADQAKARWIAAVSGRREPAVLGNGWKWQQVSVSADESQFLETNKYTAAECCRIFGPAYAEVLGYETGGSMTYSNREQRILDLLTFALDPWFVRVERALTSLLPPGTFVKINRKALLRTDLLARFQAHAVALTNKWTTIDEVRDDEDMAQLTPEQLAYIGQVHMTGSSSRQMSAAEVTQKIYLAVGKFLTVEDARDILRAAGVPLDPAIDAAAVFADMPPKPAPEVSAITEGLLQP